MGLYDMKVVITDRQFKTIEYERRCITALGAEFMEWAGEESGIPLRETIADADALLVQYARITTEAIGWLNHCRVIVRYGIGYDNIDVEAAGNKGIIVSAIPDYGSEEVSNHAVAMMLALHRRLPELSALMRRGGVRHDCALPVNRLSQATLGLLGFGRIASLVLAKLAVFGLRILVYDPFSPEEKIRRQGALPVDFDTLCRESDMISVHCPLTEQTYHKLDRRAFSMMKRGAILVNTARGAIVDEGALIEALRMGILGGAGLDTYEQEPPEAGNPLLEMENVLCSPHCAWYSEQAIETLQKKAADEVVAVLSGNRPQYQVNAACMARPL
jgi:D-3-phosphoglycerate dehydrogenase